MENIHFGTEEKNRQDDKNSIWKDILRAYHRYGFYSVLIFTYTSRGHGCGFYNVLIFVDSKALKRAHSRLRNCFSNAVYRQKSTARKPHP